MPPSDRLPTGDIARQGLALYERQIRPALNESDRGKYLFIDITTGQYILDRDQRAAFDRARAQLPEGIFYIHRVGYAAAHRLRHHPALTQR